MPRIPGAGVVLVSGTTPPLLVRIPGENALKVQVYVQCYM